MKTSAVVAVLCCVAVSFAQESQSPPPRQTFERAAYAEEHERDFEKAAQLYREAGSVAQFLGDHALADEAMNALKRVEARTGKGAETRAAGQDVPAAVQRRLFLLVRQLSSPRDPGAKNQDQKNYEAMTEIEPFGAVAVPMLEKALHAEWIWEPGASIGFTGDSTWAARALARIETPEAIAALDRGLKSPDPFVRNAVVSEVYPERHRAILDRALEDGNPLIVMAAIRRLSRLADPALQDLMMRAVKRTDGGAEAAVDWLVANSPDVAVSLMKNPEGIAPYVLGRLVEQYSERVPASRRANLAALVELAEAFADPTLAIGLFGPVMKSKSGIPAELRERVESVALRAFREARNPNVLPAAVPLLRVAGGIRTAEAWAAAFEGGRLQEFVVGNLSYDLEKFVAEVEPQHFLRAVAVVSKAAARIGNDEPRGNQAHKVSRLFDALRFLMAKKTVTDADLAAGLEATPPDQRPLYLDALVRGRDEPPIALLRHALGTSSVGLRCAALEKMARNPDPSMMADGIAALADSDSATRDRGAALVATLATAEPGQGATVLDDLVKTLDPEFVASNEVVGIARAIPTARAIEGFDRTWLGATPDRRSALVYLVQAMYSSEVNPPEVLSFLMKHFDAMPQAGQRANAISRFGHALYEPAMDLIGAALKDPAPAVRDMAREALEKFREHREALEEFKRWKAGDAEARASIAELVKLLESSNKDVVIGAVRSLAAIKAKAALPALVRLLERGDADLKKAVDEAIRKIGE